MLLIFVFGFVSGCVVTLAVFYIVAHFEKQTTDVPKQIHDEPKQLAPVLPRWSLRIGSPVFVTSGPYQGMHGKIINTGFLADEFLVYFPKQAGTETAYKNVEARILRVDVPKEASEEASAHDLT